MKKYLECEISEGMFSTEKGVEFKDINNKLISGFFPNESIKNHKLEVVVVQIKENKSLIRGPISNSGGYGFFQGSAFYVNNNLLSDMV